MCYLFFSSLDLAPSWEFVFRFVVVSPAYPLLPELPYHVNKRVTAFLITHLKLLIAESWTTQTLLDRVRWTSTKGAPRARPVPLYLSAKTQRWVVVLHPTIPSPTMPPQ